MLEVYKPHTNREAVGVCSAAKRPSKRSALVKRKPGISCSKEGYAGNGYSISIRNRITQ